jgi:hypothetical protein
MNKKILLIPIIVIFVVIMMNFSSDENNKKNDIVFHVTLADPNLYVNGIFTDELILEKGEYIFRFVPNGSSPEILSISLTNNALNFVEDFQLEGISHKTEISEYFTWKYEGKKLFSISEKQEISIAINPNGNVMGSVSVDIIEN